MIGNLGIFFIAAFFEIFGCFAFWLYFRLEKTPLWLALGTVSLILFAYVLTKIDVEQAGRVYAIYGGIYIFASLLWLVLIEKESFNRWDIIGAGICILGASVIFIGNQKVG
ncbi:MAG: YnfA family protein [Aliarcobacter sp.]|nr:YnfA family protein [Aliarcobacter sp.]